MTSLATPNAIKLPGDDGFFFAGPWKQLRMFSFVHIPFECGMVALGFLTTYLGGFLPILPLVGSSIVGCKCCCTQNAGKGMGVTYIVLNSISFLGSLGDFYYLSLIKSWCDDWEAAVVHHEAARSYCDIIDAGIAFAGICFVLRFISIILAARVVCCRPPEWNSVTQPQTQQVELGLPVAKVVEKR
mgnify:FL=1|jgi:hypothetical protein